MINFAKTSVTARVFYEYEGDTVERKKFREFVQGTFEKYLPMTKCFVMDDKAPPTILTESEVVEISKGIPLDLPFPVCSFETVGSKGLISVPSNSDPANLSVFHCFWICELTPVRYLVASLEARMRRTDWSLDGKDYSLQGLTPLIWTEDVSKEAEVSPSLSTIRKLCQLVSGQKIGLDSEPVNVVVGKKRQRRTGRRIELVKPLVVLHTSDKTNYRNVKAHSETGSVDWKHRWAVRGHWRKVQTIGKDRKGVYGVNGFTWVVPHTKGPEDMPFVNKTRVVIGEEAAYAN
jgi:hypothetical protein